MINAYRLPDNCVLSRKELAKSLPKTQPKIGFEKLVKPDGNF